MTLEAEPRELRLLEKLRALPAAKVAEVEDFVEFLASRQSDAALVDAAGRASQASLSAVWDNDEDAVYDRP